MTKITDTAFARLEAEGRLVNPVLKAPTRKAARFGFRGDLALKFAPKMADEARPPEAESRAGDGFRRGRRPYDPVFDGLFAFFRISETPCRGSGRDVVAVRQVFSVLQRYRSLEKYTVPYSGARCYVLPLDESGVYSEILELLYLEKGTLRKLDTAGKLAQWPTPR